MLLLIILFMFFSPEARADENNDIAGAMMWKYGARVSTYNGRIARWEAPISAQIPSPEQVELDVAEYKAYLDEQETELTSDIETLKSKLNLTDADLEALRNVLGR